MKKIIGKLFNSVLKRLPMVDTEYIRSVHFYKFFLRMHYISLRGIGILNYKNDKVSGEGYFLKNYLSMLEKDSVLFDVGACNGAYAKICREILPDAKIYAFEPHIKNFEKLKVNVASKNVNIYNFGLSNQETKTFIYDTASREGSAHASIYKEVLDELHKYNDTQQIAIELKVLDDFVRENEIENIDLLKIDTEGNEFSILEGATETLRANKVKCIHFEFNEMNTISRVFMRDFIKKLDNFVFYRLLSDGLVRIDYGPLLNEIFAYQNIVAVRKDIEISKNFKIVDQYCINYKFE